MRDVEKYQEYQRTYHQRRYRDDPEWRQRRIEASARYRERRKLGQAVPRNVVPGGSYPNRSELLALAEYKLQRGCLLCGFAEHAAALDLHHVDPAAKAFHVSRIDIARTPEMLAIEIEKCAVLCSNCHRMLHCGALHLVPLPEGYHDRAAFLALF